MDLDRPVFERIASWARRTFQAELPADVVDHAQRAILDGVGVTLAAKNGRVTALLDRLPDFVASGDKPPTILGHRLSATPANSSFAIAALGHELDYDDGSLDLGGHPTVVVLPAALAVAQARGASGAEVLAAYVVGAEVACALGRTLNPEHYDSGWHPTATLGAFGATSATACLLGFDDERFAQALGLTASLASGLKANFGTLTKPLQVGRTAMHGVVATELIEAGADANARAFEAAQGFVDVFERRPVDTLRDLQLPGEQGQPWSLVDPALNIKRYPCCASTHSAIDAAVRLHERLGGAEVRSCTIRLHPAKRVHVDRADPGSGLEGKFSLQYTVATALRHGRVGLYDFEDPARLFDESTRRLMDVITVGELGASDDWSLERGGAEVGVETSTGALYERVPVAIGRERGTMLSSEDVLEKFCDCTTRLGEAARTALAEQLLGLRDVVDVDELFLTSIGHVPRIVA